MSAQWKKFTGSEEQISEILNATDGVKIDFGNGGNEVYLENANGLNIKTLGISLYMLCQPHPHAEMIIEWARTGREVYYSEFGACTGKWVYNFIADSRMIPANIMPIAWQELPVFDGGYK